MIVDFQHHYTSLVELDPKRVVFATDYPQEIRERAKVRAFVDALRGLGAKSKGILDGHTGLLLPQAAGKRRRNATAG